MKPGQVLGRYEVSSLITRGGMAEVWLAHSRGHGGFRKQVVLKTIRPHLAEDPDFVRMFINEALLAARLNHPNIVQIFDLGNIGGTYFIAMEHVAGRSLRQISRASRHHGRLVPPWLVLRVVSKVCDALQYAHDLHDDQGKHLGLIHRDVTPENIMVSFVGTVRILDFGVAKATSAASLTRAGELKGKYPYIAPEQVLGEPVDRGSDVYAIGVVLYELLTGVRPFTADNDLALLQNVAQGDFPRPREVAGWVSKPVERIILRAMAHNRNDRYPDTESLGEDLLAYLTQSEDDHTQRDMGAEICQLFPDDPSLPSDVISRMPPSPSPTPTFKPVGGKDPAMVVEVDQDKDEPSEATTRPRATNYCGDSAVFQVTGLDWELDKSRLPPVAAEQPVAAEGPIEDDTEETEKQTGTVWSWMKRLISSWDEAAWSAPGPQADAPRFQVAIRTERYPHTNGQTVNGLVRAMDLARKPVPRAPVTLVAIVGANRLHETIEGQTNADGYFQFRLQVPDRRSPVQLTATVTDVTGHRESCHTSIATPAGEGEPSVQPIQRQDTEFEVIPAGAVADPNRDEPSEATPVVPVMVPTEATRDTTVDSKPAQTSTPEARPARSKTVPSPKKPTPAPETAKSAPKESKPANKRESRQPKPSARQKQPDTAKANILARALKTPPPPKKLTLQPQGRMPAPRTPAQPQPKPQPNPIPPRKPAPPGRPRKPAPTEVEPEPPRDSEPRPVTATGDTSVADLFTAAARAPRETLETNAEVVKTSETTDDTPGGDWVANLWDSVRQLPPEALDPPPPPHGQSVDPPLSTTSENTADIFSSHRPIVRESRVDADIFTSHSLNLAQLRRELQGVSTKAHPPSTSPDLDQASKAAEHFEQGLQQAQSGDYQRALEQWEAATTLDPDNRTYRSNLRRLRRRLEKDSTGR